MKPKNSKNLGASQKSLSPHTVQYPKNRLLKKPELSFSNYKLQLYEIRRQHCSPMHISSSNRSFLTRTRGTPVMPDLNASTSSTDTCVMTKGQLTREDSEKELSEDKLQILINKEPEKPSREQLFEKVQELEKEVEYLRSFQQEDLETCSSYNELKFQKQRIKNQINANNQQIAYLNQQNQKLLSQLKKISSSD